MSFALRKKTTAHTVPNRLCDRSLFQRRDSVVTSLISREEYYARYSEAYVEELKKLINEMRG